MTISSLTEQMIRYCKGSLHDIEHFLKVWAYARTIGEREGLDSQTQEILEVAAILHDIACPMCREKYGSTAKEYQEPEGAILAAEFLGDSGYPQALIDRVVYLVGHHHTLDQINGMDYQILVEADFLVNLYEDGVTKEAVMHAYNKIFRTEHGKRICAEMFGIEE